MDTGYKSVPQLVHTYNPVLALGRGSPGESYSTDTFSTDPGLDTSTLPIKPAKCMHTSLVPIPQAVLKSLELRS